MLSWNGRCMYLVRSKLSCRESDGDFEYWCDCACHTVQTVQLRASIARPLRGSCVCPAASRLDGRSISVCGHNHGHGELDRIVDVLDSTAAASSESLSPSCVCSYAHPATTHGCPAFRIVHSGGEVGVKRYHLFLRVEYTREIRLQSTVSVDRLQPKRILSYIP